MSEHIMHSAVFDDCARLASVSDRICDPFKYILDKYADIGRLGSVSRSGDMFTVHLLDKCRKQWQKRKQGDYIEETLAYMLGWRCHLAADRQFKPVFRKVEPEHYLNEFSEGPSNASVYHDVTAFREVYGDGEVNPFMPSALDYKMESLSAAQHLDPDFAQEMIDGLWQIALLEQQEFVADNADFGAWLDLLMERRENFTVDIRRYAQAYNSPDAKKFYRFITSPNFYDSEDPAIKLVRSIQKGKVDTSIDLESAVAAGANQSQYAQALHRGYRYLVAASDFFTGVIGRDELEKQSDIGKPHVPADMTLTSDDVNKW